MKKVTVCILTKNPGAIFKRVIEAVLTQDTPWPYDVLVVDSGSSDGTVEYVKRLEDVRLHQIPSHEFGHGKTRNLAVQLSNSEFVAMLTHDAKPATRFWLKNLVMSIDGRPEVAGVFGRHLPYSNASPFVSRDLKLHFDGFRKWPEVFRLEDPERYKVDQGYRQILHFYSDNNSLLRKSVWEKIPYPNVDFAEDQAWAKQIIEAGYGKVYADSAAVYHSHNYGVKEIMQRSYDESVALKNLFGYELCPGMYFAVKQALRCTFADLKYLLAQRSGGWCYWFMLAPFLNCSKQLGFYIGGRHADGNPSKSGAMSLDKKLKES